MNSLDQLVSSITAFQSWNSMLQAMKQGYIPTLNGGRSYSKLADICRRNGFKVYRKGITY